MEHHVETGSMENVVAKHQAGAIVPDEIFTNDEGLRKAVRERLFCEFKTHSEITSVSKQPPEHGKVDRG